MDLQATEVQKEVLEVLTTLVSLGCVYRPMEFFICNIASQNSSCDTVKFAMLAVLFVFSPVILFVIIFHNTLLFDIVLWISFFWYLSRSVVCSFYLMVILNFIFQDTIRHLLHCMLACDNISALVGAEEYAKLFVELFHSDRYTAMHRE